jgi:hypothetical protein
MAAPYSAGVGLLGSVDRLRRAIPRAEELYEVYLKERAKEEEEGR